MAQGAARQACTRQSKVLQHRSSRIYPRIWPCCCKRTSFRTRRPNGTHRTGGLGPLALRKSSINMLTLDLDDPMVDHGCLVGEDILLDGGHVAHVRMWSGLCCVGDSADYRDRGRTRRITSSRSRGSYGAPKLEKGRIVPCLYQIRFPLRVNSFYAVHAPATGVCSTSIELKFAFYDSHC